MPPPIILSVSDLTQHHTCPTAFLARHTTRHWAIPSKALTTGKALHQLLEAKYAPSPPHSLDTLLADPAMDPLALSLLSQIPPDWTPPYAITAAEQPLLARLGPSLLPPSWSGPPVYIAGTPDAITTRQAPNLLTPISGSGQYKSLGPGRSPESLVDSIAYGAHELLYSLLRLASGLRPTDELHVLIFRKLSQRALADGTPAFLHHIRATPHLATPESLHTLFTRDLLPNLHATLSTIHSGPLASRRAFESCTGPFYNSPCPLYAECHRPQTQPAPQSDPGSLLQYLPEPAPCRYSAHLEAQLASGSPPPTLDFLA